MTDTVNVLSHIRELKDTWRKQDFTFTKQQQEEYDVYYSLAGRLTVPWITI